MKPINGAGEISDKAIDCLFIGHYEMDCERHLDFVKKTGTSEEVFRELDLNILYHNDKPYYGSDILNLFCCETMKTPTKFFDHWGGMSLAIAYLGTYLQRKGFTFDYINSLQAQWSEFAMKLKRENVLLVAIITTYYVSYLPILEIIRFIRKYNRTAKIVVGGPFVYNQVLTLKAPGALHALWGMINADIYVNSSQGEATLVKVLEALKRNRTLESINNLYYRNGRGYTSTPVVAENNRLSENLVDWGLFAKDKPGYLNLRTAISCPFKCAFCGFPQKSGKYQTLPVEKIQEVLTQMNRIESLKTVHFIDDTLNASAPRFKRFLEILIKGKYRFKWLSFLRSHNVDKEMVALMKESGCLGVFIGFESGNDQILGNMNKGTTVEENYKCAALLKEFNILTYGSFIIGFPGETEKTAADTRRFIEKSEIDFYSNKLWFLDPGAPIMKEKEKYGIEGYQYEWSHNTMNSKQACDLVEQFLVAIKNSIHVPDYHFSFQGFLHLISKGMSLENLKSFLTGFNQGLIDKLLNPSRKNINPEVIDILKKSSTAGYRECQDYADVGQWAEEGGIDIDFDLD